MPLKDYNVRPKKKGGVNIPLILGIVILLIFAVGIGLFLLKSNAPTPVIPPSVNAKHQVELPSRPEEVWSYIRSMESRESLNKNLQLNEDQKRALEENKRKQEELLIAQQQEKEQESKTLPAKQAVENVAQTPTVEPAKITPAINKDQTQAELKTEEKRKTELKKQQELAKKVESKNEAKPEAKAPPKVAEAAAKPQAGRFGLQCGAYKNKAQAENMQARLAMAGYNARINSSTDWNRVVVGPLGDRSAAAAAQSNARSVAECLVVAM